MARPAGDSPTAFEPDVSSNPPAIQFLNTTSSFSGSGGSFGGIVGSSAWVIALMSLLESGLPETTAALDRAGVGGQVEVALLLVRIVALGAMLLDQGQNVIGESGFLLRYQRGEEAAKRQIKCPAQREQSS